jgi:hypothetical protein
MAGWERMLGEKIMETPALIFLFYFFTFGYFPSFSPLKLKKKSFMSDLDIIFVSTIALY